MRVQHRSRCQSRPALRLLQLTPETVRRAEGYPRVRSSGALLIVHDWCDVWLCLPNRDPISVATHYEEPRAVVVSPNGGWIASGGCGVVVYHLRHPYQSFDSGVESDQWWEIGRDEDDPWLVDRLRIIGEDRLRVVVDPESAHGGVYDVDVANQVILQRHLAAVQKTSPGVPEAVRR